MEPYCDMSERERSDCLTVITTSKRLHRLLRDRLDKSRTALGSDVTYTATQRTALPCWRINSPRIPRYTVRCHGKDCFLDGLCRGYITTVPYRTKQFSEVLRRVQFQRDRQLVTAGQFEELVLLSERSDIQVQLVRLQSTEHVSSE
jgi:hypothetical protein